MSKELARKLRIEEDLSVPELAQKFSVAESTMMKWVKDLPLKRRSKRYTDTKKATEKTLSTWRQRRLDAQKVGAERAKQNSMLHLMGCMLYWAEGSKNKNSITFSNTDAAMIQIFLEFLQEELKINKKDIIMRFNVHLDNNLTLEDIEKYWISVTGISKENIQKSCIKNNISARNSKHKYGVCYINVNNTQAIQHIYGAIQQYGKFIEPKWLN